MSDTITIARRAPKTGAATVASRSSLGRKRSSVRLQWGPGFGFRQVRENLGFYHTMGFRRLYLSPPFTADSVSGYDVLNFRISEQLGGEAELRALAGEAHARGMCLGIDMPHHMSDKAEQFQDFEQRGHLFDIEITEAGHGVHLDYAGFGFLARLNMDDPNVVTACLEVLQKLVEEGILKGEAGDFVRIDYYDGINRHLEQLTRQLVQQLGLQVIVEHTRDPDDRLPDHIAGTTGGEVIRDLMTAWSCERGAALIRRQGAQQTGCRLTFSQRMNILKRKILNKDWFRPHAERLLRLWERLGGEPLTLDDIIEALCVFPRRTHVNLNNRQVEEPDQRLVNELPLPECLRRAFLLQYEGDQFNPFVRLFELTVANLGCKAHCMATGWDLRFPPFNEGGVSPDTAALSGMQLHKRNLCRADHAAGGMVATATHDTINGGLATARAVSLTHHSRRILGFLRCWQEMDVGTRRPDAPGPEIEWAVYIWLLLADGTGAGQSATIEQDPVFHLARHCAREMGLGEVGERTSWTNINEQYEGGLGRWLDRLYHNTRFTESLAQARRLIEPYARQIQLCWVLMGFTPGHPDHYQGCLNWSTLLRDPHNRGLVDYGPLSDNLASFESGEPPNADNALQWVIWKCNRVINRLGHLAEGPDSYRLLSARNGLFAFTWGEVQVWVTRSPGVQIPRTPGGYVNLMQPVNKLGFQLGLWVPTQHTSLLA